MIIVITGTPGTGKTTLAKSIAKKKKSVYIDVNKLIKEYKLSEGYDRKRKCSIINIAKLKKVLVSIIKKANKSKKSLIIDSHLSHYIQPKYVDLCIVTKCSLKELKKRLQKKGYNSQKTRENLEAEAFDICLIEAREAGHKIKTVDTT